MKCKTIKFLEDSIGENLGDLRYGDDFLDISPKQKFTKERIDKLDFNKIKNFCCLRSNDKKMRKQATGWEKNICKTPI